MTKTLFSTLAIVAALSLQAGTPAHTSQFKPAAKLQGSANLSGLGTVRRAQMPAVTSSGALVSYTRSSYNPATIKEIKYAADQKNPVFIQSTTIVNTANIESAESAKNTAISFLEQNKPVIGVKNPKDEFIVKSFNKDQLGFMHIKLSQSYMGRTVMGKEMILHFSPKGTTITGRWTETPVLAAPTSLVGDHSAISVAVASLTDGRGIKPFSTYEQQLLKYTGPTSELVVYPKDNYNDTDKWAYKVIARTNFIHIYEIMVDARTGAVIHSNDISCTTGATTTTLTDLNNVSRSINTYQHSNGTYYMIDISRSMYNAGQSSLPDNPVGALWTLDAQGAPASDIQVAQETSSNNTSWPSSATAASASFNGASAYEYYKNIHNRNSIDGSGGTIISVINITDENGDPMDNAFWNGQLMAYGNGDVAFKPLPGGLDVAGHEMTHGVIQATANLNYQDQSGALNESMADVFGAMIDKSNWTIGEQVVKPAYFPSGALRDLSNPHNGTTQGNNGWQPATMSEYVTGTSDHGGVHTNSGIPSHAFYYFATAVTKQKAELVYYRALSQYLTSSSQFLDARIAVVQAAADLFGTAEIQAAKNAFDQVEIYDGTNTQPTTNTPVAGNDWIILQNTDNSSGQSALYMVDPSIANPQSSDFHPLNTTFAINNVSIPDNGSIAYFVGTDNNVYSLTTNISGAVQTPILTTGDWGNVSVSRDGRRLALVTQYQDTSIYIYDISSGNSVQYHLYNPTYSNINTNGPVYADALDWDPTGEFLIYDEKNVFNNVNSSTDISYWDIGLIRAWDNGANTFGSGEISKLVNDLPDGVSIENPVFSKNHSDIVAFDVNDANSGTYDIQAANTSTGDIGTVLIGSNVPGTPSYSSADDKITFTTTDSLGTYYVGIESIAADLINGNGQPSYITSDGEWSVWFTIGNRANAQCAGLSADIMAQGSTDYPLTSVVLDAGAGYSSYHWNTGATTRTITVTTAGTYAVTVSTGSGCTLSTNPLTIGYPTGIHDVHSEEVKIYPVPAADNIYISMINPGDYTTADITDMTGRVVLSTPLSSHTQQVSISSIEAGVYTIHVRDQNNNRHYTSRIVKQ